MAKSTQGRDWPALTVRMPRAIYDQIVALATKTHRTMSATGLILIEKALAEQAKEKTDA